MTSARRLGLTLAKGAEVKFALDPALPGVSRKRPFVSPTSTRAAEHSPCWVTQTELTGSARWKTANST